MKVNDDGYTITGVPGWTMANANESAERDS